MAAAAAWGLPTDWERLAAEVGLTQELADAIRAGVGRRSIDMWAPELCSALPTIRAIRHVHIMLGHGSASECRTVLLVTVT